MRLLFVVPLVNQAGHYTAEFIKLLLVVHHLLPCQAGDCVIFSQEDGLFRANLFAQTAVDAAYHVDLEFLRKFLDLAPPVFYRDFPGMNGDRARRTDELAELTSDAALPAMFIRHKGGCTAVVRG